MIAKREWLLIFALCTAIGLLSASMFITENLLENVSEPISYILINELTGAYGVFLLLPILFRFFSLLPIRKNNLIVSIPGHLVASVIFGVSHTLFMTVSRMLLYPLFGLATYKMGDPFFRMLMEYSKQFLIYILILAGWEVIAAYRRNREREKRTTELELQAAQLQARLGEAQLESLKGQLQPHFLFNTLNMI
ncbi:histidine kinase, partial [bacterium]|nr:histidine kinase [bacterium]